MNTLSKWTPFHEMETLQNRLSTLFERPLRRSTGEPVGVGGTAAWTPLVHVSEDDHEFVIKAELPDMRKEDGK
jgi:HSP20 family protein